MPAMIVTNNPMVAAKYRNVYFRNDSVEETLIRVRDLVYAGHELITHPLTASLRMFYSSYRSVILGKQQDKTDFLSAQTIENSIIKYKMLTDHRVKNMNVAADYQMIDLILLESALHEQPGEIYQYFRGCTKNETGDWPNIHQGYPIRTGDIC